MPPQAIFAATCHVTPLGTAPNRRNTVLGRPLHRLGGCAGGDATLWLPERCRDGESQVRA
jgi:hypothetical protein